MRKHRVANDGIVLQIGGSDQHFLKELISAFPILFLRWLPSMSTISKDVQKYSCQTFFLTSTVLCVETLVQ